MDEVGGLDGPISAIVRRALASRLYPRALTKELGVSPVRGTLLGLAPTLTLTLTLTLTCGRSSGAAPTLALTLTLTLTLLER